MFVAMDLGEGLVIEILVRLPVKCLLKFRCVCKAWCLLIKSPRFVDLHFNHHRNEANKYVLLKLFKARPEPRTSLSFHSYHDNESLSLIAPDLQRFDEALVLVGHCNGIVCLENSRGTIYLCNPATRECRRIPGRPFGCPQGFYCGLQSVGFGFDPRTNEYKVVALVPLAHESFEYLPDDPGRLNCLKPEIYNLSSNSWREADAILPFGGIFDGLFFNGSYHWSGKFNGGLSDYTQVNNPWNYFILCFDMNVEVFREMQYPDENVSQVSKCLPQFAVLDDSLGLVLLCSNEVSDEQAIPEFISIWVMVEYGVPESWTKRISIGPFYGMFNSIASWINDKIFLETLNGELVSCDVWGDSHEVKNYGIDECGCEAKIQAIIYKESLVSIM